MHTASTLCASGDAAILLKKRMHGNIDDREVHMLPIPIGLQHALESGECVLFVGCGIGEHLTTPTGTKAPNSGAKLAAELASAFGITTNQTDLTKIAELIELRKGSRAELEAYLRKLLADLHPDSYLCWIASVRWRAIFTTNYDVGLERAYELTPNPPQKPTTISITPDLAPFDSRFEVPIYHLHGVLFGVDDPQIVITRQDYARYSARWAMLFELLKSQFAASTFLYIGYSNNDPHWAKLLADTAAEYFPSQMPVSFRVSPDTDSTDAELLRAQNVETINVSFAEFVEAATSTLRASHVDPDRLKRLHSSLPSDLQLAFEKNPAAVARLMTSWIYVNQAPFSEEPNIKTFLRGDRPNWGLIGANAQFHRDLEEAILDEQNMQQA
jgi:SIR2-like domain